VAWKEGVVRGRNKETDRLNKFINTGEISGSHGGEYEDDW
jgi:hypothetical protein